VRTNPFRIHGVVAPPYFADREAEVERLERTLREAGAKLLVYGERRMGKTSAIGVAVQRVEASDGVAMIADLSTASTVTDMTNRLLDAAARRLGRRWSDVVGELIGSLGVTLKVVADPVTGLLTPSLDVGARSAPLETQRQSLARVLDTLNGMARRRGKVMGIVLDEFQEIHRFGGEEAEWHLRGVIQHHESVSYVLAGSQPHLIRRMLGKGRAFFGMLEKMEFGPIDAGLLAEWIDDRMREQGIRVAAAGEVCLRLAGPRTRDVVRLARKGYDLAVEDGKADAALLARAFEEIVDEEDGVIRSWWEGLTSHQQNVVRATAVSSAGLTTRETLRRFSLESSSAVSQAVAKFVEDGDVVGSGARGYSLDSPFMRGWVIRNALPDLGIHLPITFRPGDPVPGEGGPA
jgi:AAA+ ATPase superfamily predicted ATPase